MAAEQEHLETEARHAFVKGFKGAIERIIFSYGSTSTLNSEQRLDLRKIWKAAFMAGVLPDDLDRAMAEVLPPRLNRRRAA
ncbi:hypothetical protein ACFL6C_06800 [Myxococcota bacterium]